MIHTDLCIVIPIHKPSLDDAEIVSLKQCKKVLGNYPVYLIYPNHLDVSVYKQIFPELLPLPVNEKWFKTVEQYNLMKRSLWFYQLFKDYHFMLTYELDAFIFSSNWNKANVFEYDYIGAPWLKTKESIEVTPWGVGNSGFSVRNISKCIEILNFRKKYLLVWKLLYFTGLHKIFSFSWLLHFFSHLSKKKIDNTIFLNFFFEGHINEDYYWGLLIPQIFTFKVASVRDAIAFSFEKHPSKLYAMNNNQLPIGCHAWEKYEPWFWRPYIQ